MCWVATARFAVVLQHTQCAAPPQTQPATHTHRKAHRHPHSAGAAGRAPPRSSPAPPRPRQSAPHAGCPRSAQKGLRAGVGCACMCVCGGVAVQAGQQGLPYAGERDRVCVVGWGASLGNTSTANMPWCAAEPPPRPTACAPASTALMRQPSPTPSTPVCARTRSRWASAAGMSCRQRTMSAPPWHSRLKGVAATAASSYAHTAGARERQGTSGKVRGASPYSSAADSNHARCNATSWLRCATNVGP